MKNNTSALDLYKLAEEFQSLVGAKVNKIYNDGLDFTFDFFKTGTGKILFRLILPDFAFVTKYKPAYGKEPSRFCMFLRKYLNNSIVRSVRQAGFERILELDLETKEKKFILIIELFSRGNMILCDENYKIISPMQPQSWQARTIRGGTKYEYPPEQNNPVTVEFEDFKEIIENSDKESVVKSLATDLSLSGVYAEEACYRAEIDKQESTLSDDEYGKLFDVVKGMFEEKIHAKSIGNQVFPFEMKSIKEKGEKNLSFYEAIDENISRRLFDAESEEAEDFKNIKLEKAKLILEKQEETIKRMRKEIEINQRKGELLFEKYQEVKGLLDEFNKDRKELTWEEMKEKYSNNPLIKQINEKEGLLVVDL